jgi:hypothetical protein
MTLSKLPNTPAAQIATMRDIPNDVSMFRTSDISVSGISACETDLAA